MDLCDNWKKSNKTVQVVFELDQTVTYNIRKQAIEHGISPSDQIRAIIGLSSKKPKRPRLTVCLSDIDYEILAKRYNLSSHDKMGIRQAIADELITCAELPEDETV